MPDVDPVEDPVEDLRNMETAMKELADPKNRLLKSDLSDYNEMKDLVKELDLKPKGRSKEAHITILKKYRDENL